MILLDSNIVIYLRLPEYGEKIAAQIKSDRLCTSAIIVAEVLGCGELSATDERFFAELFATMRNLPIDEAVTRKVIELRRAMTIQLPDAFIAAAALVHNATLWSHNLEDFGRIPGLALFDPLAS